MKVREHIPQLLTRSLLFLFLFTFSFSQYGGIAFGLPPEQKQLLDGGVRFFDIEQDNLCGPGPGVKFAGVEALKKQQGLDQRWIDIISRAAGEKGVDPIFMAGLLYVENRGYPEYKTSGWSVDASSGSGPWQIIEDTWPASAGPYSDASNPEIATFVAAEVVKNMGGDSPNLPMGSIRDDFSRGNKLKTVAALGKNYNAGPGTFRNPGVAGYKEPGRSWAAPGRDWGATKSNIIDNYILIFQHVYYHIASGQQIPPYGDNNEHAAAALAIIDTIEGFDGGGTPVASGTTTGSSDATVVALDPGHGGAVAEYTDPITGLGDRETTNSPEREDMQDVANQAKALLEQVGYTVVLLRNNPTDSVSKRQRIDAAKAAGADIGISLHTDSGAGTFESWAEVWPQFVGGFRQSASDPSKRVEFTNAEVAAKSDEYTNIITEERDKAERGGQGITKKVVDQSAYFSKERGLPSYGNLSLMGLWADTIPWVYNESGAAPGGLTDQQKVAYATGIVNGVKRALPTSGGSNTSCATQTGSGNVTGTALAYAWPDYRGKNYLEMKPEYLAATVKARSEGRYIGGYDGVDCGGFVTTVMVDSGFEPNYNYKGLVKEGASNTEAQLRWSRDNWTLVGKGSDLSSANLQPGDVAFRVNPDGSNDGHTFMWVGTQPNFETEIASSSLGDRAPMAGREDSFASNIEWYRKR